MSQIVLAVPRGDSPRCDNPGRLRYWGSGDDAGEHRGGGLRSMPELAAEDWRLSGVERYGMYFFSFAYVARLWTCAEGSLFGDGWRGCLRCRVSPRVLVDLAATLPFYLAPFAHANTVVFRLLRVLRLVRAFKLGRLHSSPAGDLAGAGPGAGGDHLDVTVRRRAGRLAAGRFEQSGVDVVGHPDLDNGGIRGGVPVWRPAEGSSFYDIVLSLRGATFHTLSARPDLFLAAGRTSPFFRW
jgi:hypothetical protein